MDYVGVDGSTVKLAPPHEFGHRAISYDLINNVNSILNHVHTVGSDEPLVFETGTYWCPSGAGTQNHANANSYHGQTSFYSSPAYSSVYHPWNMPGGRSAPEAAFNFSTNAGIGPNQPSSVWSYMTPMASGQSEFSGPCRSCYPQGQNITLQTGEQWNRIG
ncbi:unnamed protein product [Protopolystoma xenopodis]|uniref:Uncharacterized protein n=1 Tax=Protopolystoma xenopodis TaxID=117903 RepID=A0A3S5ADB7_9PLAT|nr:unnamed protein product [Protopolystoma xenopodis]